jgi:hypothetical protein
VIRRTTDRGEHLSQLALKLAAAETDDDHARDRLVTAAGGDERALSEAHDLLRTDQIYLHERARRLLRAAASGGPVAPPPTDFRNVLFTKERALDTMSPEEAFGVLADLEPRLRRLEAKVQARSSDRPGSPWSVLRMTRELETLLGEGSRSENPLLRSPIAERAARLYLAKIAGFDADRPSPG